MSAKLKKVTDLLVDLTTYAVGIEIVLATLLVVYGAIMRYILGISYLWLEEVVRYLCLSAAFIGCGPMVIKGGHISIDFLVPIFTNNSKRKLIFELLLVTASMVMASLLIMWSLPVLQAYGGSQTASLQFPAWIPYSLLPMGMIFVIIFSLLKLAWIIVDWKGGVN